MVSPGLVEDTAGGGTCQRKGLEHVRPKADRFKKRKWQVSPGLSARSLGSGWLLVAIVAISIQIS